MAYLPRSARPSKDTAPEVALFRNNPPLAASAARMPLNPYTPDSLNGQGSVTISARLR